MGSEFFGLDADYLLRKLLIKRSSNSDNCTSLIKWVMRGDQDVCAATSIKLSLICPLGKSKIVFPCRSKACTHAQCFDAKQLFMLNQIKRMVKCPVCNEKLSFDDLIIDRYFCQVIQSLFHEVDVTEIELFADGTWEPILVKQMEDSISPDSPPAKRARLTTTVYKNPTVFVATTDRYLTPMEKASEGNRKGAEMLSGIAAPVDLIDLTADDDSDVVYID